MRSRGLELMLTSLAGLLSGYLLYRQRVRHSGDVDGLDLCVSLFSSTCDEVVLASSSYQLGVPLAGLGLLFFSLMMLLLLLEVKWADRLVFWLSSSGVGVCIVLIIVMNGQKLYCPICIIIHGLVLWIFLKLLVSSLRQTDRKNWIWTMVLSVFFLLVGAYSETVVLANGFGTMGQPQDDTSYAKWSRQVIESKLNEPHRAPIELTVFSSFQCPGCQGFNFVLKSLAKEFGDLLYVHHVQYPMSMQCNPYMEYEMQPNSCYAAKAAIAARKQDRYQAFSDALFMTSLNCDSVSVEEVALAIGLDMDRWKSDLADSATAKQLSDDIDIANELAINATPTVYLNGRRMPTNNQSKLRFFIEKELKSR
ncbi:MAG: thioredoxin domain-containing protein [Saprospiraceae bacterium]|nr:thioredoxin domain-containing protein [Saprospiraceae bacterium]